jgi:hypothetical protein
VPYAVKDKDGVNWRSSTTIMALHLIDRNGRRVAHIGEVNMKQKQLSRRFSEQSPSDENKNPEGWGFANNPQGSRRNVFMPYSRGTQ